MVAVIGLNVSGATEVLVTARARFTCSAGINERSDANSVTDLEPRDVFSCCGNKPDNLVAWNHWVGTLKPLVSGLVDIAVANARILDVDCHHLWT